MAKKGLLGKLLTATAAVAAIGGVCYFFKDKIKESKLYDDLDIDNRLKQLKSLFEKEDEDDFFDEDEELFGEQTNTGSDRNYVSLNTDNNSDVSEDGNQSTASEDERQSIDSEDKAPDTAAQDTDFTAALEDETVPTISLDTFITDDAEAVEDATEDDLAEDNASESNTLSTPDDAGADADADVSEDTEASGKGETPIAYDMEGLSDVSEDPDVLIEQDLLDDGPYYL